ncbi:MAG: response regulator transcription factor, partial [Longicatena sp.]
MNDNTKVLLIEDDKNIIKFLSLSLETNGCKVISAQSGIEGISLFMTDNPDLILLDLGLPDIDGSEVLSQIRTQSDVPILIVSARGQEKEKVEALDLGADDYITKPFHINELLARIRVALRKKTPQVVKDKVFKMDSLYIDFEKYKVFVEEKEIHLTPIEFKLLVLLIENAGKVLTHSFIIKKIWGYNTCEDSQSLRVFMANIRRKIEKDSSHPRYIVTEVGV